ncbi:hypothetical protein [Parachryseolinea silvisoli]|uniref:hypothetical protein n=1 Tax=Parachryseolinea silvisoli TaxID=2873601 RepID=UPI002265AF8C|nr:hypothetical protein [Parachryseolinea silvisoli]MCD9015240.1 hypothetical protein [Parachryseolinea silvisoli]
MAKTAKKTAKKAAKKTAKKAVKKVAKKTAKKASKPGPKDRNYVNSKEPYEVAYAPKRKTPAKKFAKRKAS